MDVGVANDQIALAGVGDRRTRAAGQGSRGDDAQRRHAEERATVVDPTNHFGASPSL
jgi:hypothetical protein